MAAVKAGTVRQNPETLQVAVKMDLPKDKAWFVLDVSNGGHYTDGEREKVTEWPQLVPDNA